MNNYGYGIIKQFQDSYFESRYEASGSGYSQPNFRAVIEGYGIPVETISSITDLKKDVVVKSGPVVFDVQLHPNTLIEPKLEMGNPIHRQFPYLDDNMFKEGTPYFPD